LNSWDGTWKLMELRSSGKVTTEVMDIKVENDDRSRQPNLNFC